MRKSFAYSFAFFILISSSVGIQAYPEPLTSQDGNYKFTVSQVDKKIFNIYHFPVFEPRPDSYFSRCCSPDAADDKSKDYLDYSVEGIFSGKNDNPNVESKFKDNYFMDCAKKEIYLYRSISYFPTSDGGFRASHNYIGENKGVSGISIKENSIHTKVFSTFCNVALYP